MKKYIITLLISAIILPCFAQKDAQAKKILDQTSTAFANAGGIKATFTIKAGGGQTKGTLQLSNKKFLLNTNDATTWFDGKTQWSYLKHSDEVNISVPSEEELQSMNPYALLNIYKKGFNYQYNGTVGNNYKITLTPENKKNAFSRIVLLISKTNYQPQHITLEQQKNKSEITVTGYQTKQSFSNSLFQFNKKNYPHAEIIDLR
ncbi:LolA-like putative outer membrane lipoprotein chaperone [uncultured Bacteroides sp.]|uniref:LolA-like putative outer membrane lipoprotein chaperone n=1 Tax=uncultured Bacteroides sp. TaxID=162156 RepID=UPI002AABFD86|nr:LolA-like putative outer membrane lipoprotein chaperone [uncultured Bacteroides sp.]